MNRNMCNAGKRFSRLVTPLAMIFFLSIFGQTGHAGENSPAGTQVFRRLITIPKGLSIVTKDSRLVKIELAEKDIAFEDTILALSALLPHLGGELSKTWNRDQPAFKFGSTVAYTSEKNPIAWGVDVYQTLFDFGKSISQYQASTEILHARKANIDTITNMVMLEFVTSYFDLLEMVKMIHVAETEVESLSSYLDDMQHLYEQGVIVDNDLLPAKVKLADAKQRLIATRNYREVMAARINTILTIPLTKKIEVADVNLKISDVPDPAGAWSLAEKKRPEIVFYNDLIKASALSERAKAVSNLPTIYGDAGYTYTKNQYLLNNDEVYFKLGAKLNFYDGGATGAEIMKERYRREKLKEQKMKLVEDIQFEIEDSLTGVKNAQEKLAVAEGALAQAEENVRVYRVKSNNGVATPTDVLEAIALQTKAQINFYSAGYELKKYYAKLMHAVGIDLRAVYKTKEEERDGPNK